MFEESLTTKFKSIFDLKKNTFDEPGDSLEQETLFIQVDSVKNSIRDGRATGSVRGSASVYAAHDKMPFGYFSKAIRNADLSDTKDLFFFDIEESQKVLNNIVRRSFSFVYFFEQQYDPEVGIIDEVTIEESES